MPPLRVRGLFHERVSRFDPIICGISTVITGLSFESVSFYLWACRTAPPDAVKWAKARSGTDFAI